MSDPADLLTQHGLQVRALSHSYLSAASDSGDRRVQVIAQTRAPSPKQLALAETLADDQVTLFVLPAASLKLREKVKHMSGVAVATRNELVHFPDVDTLVQHEPARRPRGRIPWGKFAVIRSLLRTSLPRQQAALATEAGISQGSVSLVLHRLDHLVRKDRGGWVATDPEALWNLHLAEYPGAGGLRTYWFSMLPFNEISDTLKGFGVISGDASADRIAPWRIPVRAVLYTEASVDMDSLGFSPATQDESNIELCIPADATVFSTAGSGIADPPITASDLRRIGGNDARKAIEELKSFTLTCWSGE